MASDLTPNVLELSRYYDDLAHVLTKRDIMTLFNVSRHEVEYAQDNGHIIWHRDGNSLFFSSTSVLDWVRKKYGAEVLTRGMKRLYAAKSALRSESSINPDGGGVE